MNTSILKLSALSVCCAAALSACGGGGGGGLADTAATGTTSVLTAATGSTSTSSATTSSSTSTTTTSSSSSSSSGSTTSSGSTATSSNPTDLCAGVSVTGRQLVNYSALAKPAKLTPVTDPDFGTKIIRITDAKADWNSGVSVPAYGTIQAWNADESYLILYVTDPLGSGGVSGSWGLFNGKTYQFIKWLDINPADVEQFYWSTTNANDLYYVDNYSIGSSYNSALTMLNVSTGVKTVIHNFANDMKSGGALAGYCPVASFMHVSGGEDPFAMSKNNDLIGLGCYQGKNGPGGSAEFYAFSYRLSTGAIGTPKLVEADVPQALPSGKGTYFYNGTSNVQTLNAATNAVVKTIAFNGQEHSDMFQNAAGDDIVAGVQFDGPSGSGALMWANLTTGTVSTLIGEQTGDGYPPSGVLVSGRAYKNPGWVAEAITGCPAGTNGNCSGSTPKATSNPQTFLDQEVLLANVDTGAICRIAHNRSTGNYNNASTSNYWAQPNVIVSPSGTRVLFASDWGDANPKSPTVNANAVTDTYVVELPGYKAN